MFISLDTKTEIPICGMDNDITLFWLAHSGVQCPVLHPARLQGAAVMAFFFVQNTLIINSLNTANLNILKKLIIFSPNIWSLEVFTRDSCVIVFSLFL